MPFKDSAFHNVALKPAIESSPLMLPSLGANKRLKFLRYSNSLLSEVPARSITNYQLPITNPAIDLILLRKAISHFYPKSISP
ncbi:MAG: hypothetical protein HC786_17135 [Richelia sp. CSU_2_1]|nr:hypothetical protein [Richelia sp. CSU_2_1]